MVTQGLFESDLYEVPRNTLLSYIHERGEMEFPLASANGARSWNPEPLFQFGGNRKDPSGNRSHSGSNPATNFIKVGNGSLP